MTANDWSRLSNKARWDIMVSLRGPDAHYGDTLKWFTTAVIRGRVSGAIYVGGVVNPDLNLLILPKYPFREPSVHIINGQYWNVAHFIEHLSEASTWLNIPNLTLPVEFWHKVMKRTSRQKAAVEILSKMRQSAGLPNTLLQELQRHYDEYLANSE